VYAENDIICGAYSLFTKLPDIEYLRFKQQYCNHFNESLILGYYCHLLSDYKWVQVEIPGFPKNIDCDSEEFLALRKVLHKDYGLLNIKLKKHLTHPDSFVIPNDIIVSEIDKSFIPGVLSGVGQDFKCNLEGRLTMLTTDIILNYIDDAVNFCIDNIKKLN